MNLIKMPYEVSNDFHLKALIYGQPGIGKSTLALSAPNAVLIDCDNGIHRIAPNHRVPFLPVKNYQEVLDVINSPDISGFETIVIDTAGKLLDFMAAYIIQREPKMGRKDGALTLQGYGVRKYEFINLLKLINTKGKHVVFVAHENETRDGDEKTVRPEIGGSSGGDLIKELDLVGYMEAIGRKRTISFAPCEKYYAKNSARMSDMMEVPDLPNGTPNTFLTCIIDRCKAALAEESEKVREYEELMQQVNDAIKTVKDLETANKALETITGLAHFWDSKPKAWELLKAKTASLEIEYSTENKSYVSTQRKSA